MPVMAAADAQLFWLSAKVRNDQFLLYIFDGTPCARAVDEVRSRAQACEELCLRVRDDNWWSYPTWVRGEIDDRQFVEHRSMEWQQCLDTLARADQLDATVMSWRMHIFRSELRCVVAIQMTHAVADGTRAAALAGVLLGRRNTLPAVVTPDRGFLPWKGLMAARAHLQFVRDVEAGLLPAPQGPRPALSVNAAPAGTSTFRTLEVRREDLPGPTVTVGALVAVSEALGGYLAERGEDITRLGAEVPMAAPFSALSAARNNFRNVGVGLFPELNRRARAERIAAELAGHRRRGAHPAMLASEAAFAATPAVVLRWGVGKFDPSARTPAVTGNTIVSSVNRGPADLSFGGCPVLLTAGYPALSQMQSLTHGVHGIGGRLAISVHADTANVDVDAYMDRLSDALGCQA